MYLTNQGNYHPAFVILSTTLEDYLPKIHMLMLMLNYCYRGLLIMCFFLSLDNRHQRSSWGYTLAFIGFGFGFITIYMTVAVFSPSRSFSSLSENKFIPGTNAGWFFGHLVKYLASKTHKTKKV